MLVQTLDRGVGRDHNFIRVADIVALRHHAYDKATQQLHPRTKMPIELIEVQEAFFVRTRDGKEHGVTEEDFGLLVRSWGLLRDQKPKVEALEALINKHKPATPAPGGQPAQEPYNDEHGDRKPALTDGPWENPNPNRRPE
jgi:hypothetical protein